MTESGAERVDKDRSTEVNSRSRATRVADHHEFSAFELRRGAGVVERGGLENRHNPSRRVTRTPVCPCFLRISEGSGLLLYRPVSARRRLSGANSGANPRGRVSGPSHTRHGEIAVTE